jgi:hypothetical protein
MGRLTKIEKSMIILPPYQKSVLVGIMLSDGHLASSTGKSSFSI